MKKDKQIAAVGAVRDAGIETKKLSPEFLISKAIDKNLPVETMEKLLAMRTQLKQEWAKEEYNRALSEFQARCPAIAKTKIVKDKHGDVRYKYAPLESIIEQVKDLLHASGFSYTFNAVYEREIISDKGMKNGGAQIITCTARHIAGWSEVAEFRSPIDWGAYMSDVQKQGSAMTFAKRYAFCSVFGIMTGDEDDDGQTEPTEPKKTSIRQADRQTITPPPREQSKKIDDKKSEKVPVPLSVEELLNTPTTKGVSVIGYICEMAILKTPTTPAHDYVRIKMSDIIPNVTHGDTLTVTVVSLKYSALQIGHYVQAHNCDWHQDKLVARAEKITNEIPF